MGLFDFFGKKRRRILSEITSDISDDDLRSRLPFLTSHFLTIVQDASIQFYRDIHSHDSGGFNTARDEICFLLYFVTDNRIRSALPDSSADLICNEFRNSLSARIFDQYNSRNSSDFWELYSERKKVYAAHNICFRSADTAGVASRLKNDFAAHMEQQLYDWGALVVHHASEMAIKAICMLEEQ
jgi:hypothetical protein